MVEAGGVVKAEVGFGAIVDVNAKFVSGYGVAIVLVGDHYAEVAVAGRAPGNLYLAGDGGVVNRAAAGGGPIVVVGIGVGKSVGCYAVFTGAQTGFGFALPVVGAAAVVELQSHQTAVRFGAFDDEFDRLDEDGLGGTRVGGVTDEGINFEVRSVAAAGSFLGFGAEKEPAAVVDIDAAHGEGVDEPVFAGV